MPEFRHQRRRAAIGAGLIVALSALALFIFFLDELKRAGTDTYHIVGVFRNAPELKPGAAVWIAGHEVGRVRRVEFLRPAADRSPRIAAVLELPAGVRPLVRHDSELRLISERPLGKRVVDLTPGTGAVAPLEAGDTLRADEAARFDRIEAEAARFGAALDSLLVVARAVDTLAARRAPAFRRTAAALEAAQSEFERLTTALERGPLSAFIDNPEWRGALVRLQESVAEISRAFPTAAPGETDRAALGPAFRRLARHARLLGERLAGLQSLLAAPAGLPSRMARDSALAAAVNDVRAQLDSLMAETKKEPWRFVF